MLIRVNIVIFIVIVIVEEVKFIIIFVDYLFFVDEFDKVFKVFGNVYFFVV